MEKAGEAVKQCSKGLLNKQLPYNHKLHLIARKRTPTQQGFRICSLFTSVSFSQAICTWDSLYQRASGVGKLCPPQKCRIVPVSNGELGFRLQIYTVARIQNSFPLLCPQHRPEDASCSSQSCSAGQGHASLLLVWLKASRLTAVQMVPSGSHEIDEHCYPIKEGLAGCAPSPLCSLGK